MRRGETAVIISGVLLSLLIWYYTFFLPTSYYQSVGGEVYPRIIGTIVLAISLFMLFRQMKPGLAKNPQDTQPIINIPKEAKKVLLGVFVITFFYMLLVTYIGYFVTTLVFLVVMMWSLSEYNSGVLMRATLISLVITFMLFVSFSYAFHVYLPKGLLF